MTEQTTGATKQCLAVLARIDEFNRRDPNRLEIGGRDVPKELFYSERMGHWLNVLAPESSDALRIAVRAQHIGRWTMPRSDYPEGREGYLRWRRDLAAFHAKTTGEILAEVGYDEAMIARVGQLLRKQNLKRDPEAQLLEDVACLVFLENFFTPFSRQHDDAKVVDILRKTWDKMSPRGRAAALTLKNALPKDRQQLMDAALAGAPI